MLSFPWIEKCTFLLLLLLLRAWLNILMINLCALLLLPERASVYFSLDVIQSLSGCLCCNSWQVTCCGTEVPPLYSPTFVQNCYQISPLRFAALCFGYNDYTREDDCLFGWLANKLSVVGVGGILQKHWCLWEERFSFSLFLSSWLQ